MLPVIVGTFCKTYYQNLYKAERVFFGPGLCVMDLFALTDIQSFLIMMHSYIQFTLSSMATNWNILNWNIRGINDKDKWLALKDKIIETNCDVIFIQETKRELFDSR